MIRKITKNIYLSGADEILDLENLKNLGINAILNVASEVTDPCYPPNDFMQIKIGLQDNNYNPNYLKDMAIQALQTLVSNDKIVLVHCMAGASRSPYVIFRYLAETEHRTMDAIYKEFMTQYPDAGITISALNYVN